MMGVNGAEREGGGGSGKASCMSRTSLLRAGGLLWLLRGGCGGRRRPIWLRHLLRGATGSAAALQIAWSRASPIPRSKVAKNIPSEAQFELRDGMQCMAEQVQSALQSRGLAELGHEDEAHSPGAARNNTAEGRLSSVTVCTRRCHQVRCLISYGVLTSSVCLVAAHHEATPWPQQDLRALQNVSQAVWIAASKTQTQLICVLRAPVFLRVEKAIKPRRTSMVAGPAHPFSSSLWKHSIAGPSRLTVATCAIDNDLCVMLHAQMHLGTEVTTPHEPQMPSGKGGTAGLHHGPPC